MKIGIIGSLNYQDIVKVTEILWELKNKYKNNLVIATGANDVGIDKITKQLCKWKIGINYTEFPPYFKKWNSDCQLNGESKYKYNKPYKPGHYFIRYHNLIKWSEFLFLFGGKNDKEVKKILDIIKKSKKRKKYLLVK